MSKIVERKYKKPLLETRKVDNWKCPYCRKIITEIPKKLQYSEFSIYDGEFEETCIECGKASVLFISPMFIARPLDD